PTRAHLLAGLSRMADAAVLAGEPAPADSAPADSGDEDETPRDRLFDVMMRRFDALLPYRDGLAAVMRDLRREPLTALAFAPHIARSMAWMLRAARIDPDAPGGAVLVAGLVAAHARVMRVFLADDTADLARTMAALDAELRRGESWLAALRRRDSRRTAPREPADAPVG
ncbi:MAG TPA: TetR/AcrR family transcriptional regulator, partial [Azospirillum sp.]